jgi:gliding motility-associated-like protein
LGDLRYPRARHDCGDGEVSYYFIDSINLEEIIPNTPREIAATYCPLTFPMVLDGNKLAGVSSSAEPLSWLWQDSINTPRLTIYEKGNYRLSANFPNCIREDYIIQVGDKDCQVAIFAPNIFTPDGDGINDLFEFHHKGILWDQLTVYNRYGEPVFSTANPGLGWDGNVWSGSPSPPGVYVYMLQYKIISTGKMTRLSGSVTLIR